MDRSPRKHSKPLVWRGVRTEMQDAHRGLLPQGAAERFLIDRCRVFRLAQRDLNGGGGTVEWSIISRPLPKGRFECSAIRAEAEGSVCGSAAVRKRRSSVVVHTWHLPLEHAFVKGLATRLRTVRVPLEPGMSRAAVAFFTLCEFDIGLLDSALSSTARMAWINPRRGPWEGLIACFHQTWIRLESMLDGHPPPRLPPVPPRGGEAALYDYLEYRRLHPLFRLSCNSHMR